MQKNVSSQKVVLLALDVSTNAPKTGDAANLTAYVSKDWGAVTVLGDTTATELDATNAPGLYSFDLTQAETNADELIFSGKSSTANIKVVPRIIQTVPGSFSTLTIANNATAANATRWNGTAVPSEHTAGYPIVTIKDGTGTGEINTNAGAIANVDLVATLTTYTGNTPQTGDAYAIVNSGVHGNAAIKGYVDDIGVAGAGLTDIGGFSTTAKGQIQTEAEDAIVAHRLDELLNADSDIDGAAPPTVGSVFHELMTKTTGSFTFDQTTDSLEALRDNHPANFSTLTIASNAALATLSNLAHGGTSATLRLGSSTTTPALYVTNSGGNASRFESTGNDGHGILSIGIGAGDGAHFEGGATGDGLHLQGDNGVHCVGTTAATYINGVLSVTGASTFGGAITATNASNDIRGVKLHSTGLAAVTAWTVAITGNITGNLSGSVGSISGVTFPTNFSVLAITSAGLVATTSNVKKNQALASFAFLMTDSTNHAPATGLTVSVTRSIDGAAFASGSLSSVTEVANGIYKVDFAAADLNGNVVVLKATATGADTTFERVITVP